MSSCNTRTATDVSDPNYFDFDDSGHIFMVQHQERSQKVGPVTDFSMVVLISSVMRPTMKYEIIAKN